MKQAVGSLDADTLEVLAGAPPGFAVLGGDDAFLLPTVLRGAPRADPPDMRGYGVVRRRVSVSG